MNRLGTWTIAVAFGAVVFTVVGGARGAVAGSLPDDEGAEPQGPPPKVSYNGKTFSVTFSTTTLESETCQKARCFVGATVRRASDAFHFDLPAKEVNAADLKKPITLSTDVGPGFVQFQVGLWSIKTPCAGISNRHGCKTYKYLLASGEEANLEGMPEWFYPPWGWSSVSAKFQDIRPSRIQLLDAGGGEGLVAKAKSAMGKVAGELKQELVAGGKAQKGRDYVEILYRGLWDRPSAWKIAAALKSAGVGIRWDLIHWPEAPENFVIALGGKP